MAHEESPNSLMAIIGTKHNICPGLRDHESDRAGLALGCVSCSLTGWAMEPTQQQQIDKQTVKQDKNEGHVSCFIDALQQ